MNAVKTSAPNKNTFDLSHDVKFSANMGHLIPTLAMECIPGDKFQIGCDSLIRFAPLVSPTMHRFDMSMHYFFVPYRLLWEGFENYITQTDPGTGIPAHPFVNWNMGNTNTYPLMDYFGIPRGTTVHKLSPFAMSAYQFIYNEYYRDQNLQTEIPYQLLDGNNDANIVPLATMRKRAWERDYFTSALPFPQKGDAAQLPIGTISEDVPVYLNNGGSDTGQVSNANAIPFEVTGQASTTPQQPNELYAATAGTALDPVTINDFRIMMKLQEWREKLMRGGSRYFEYLLSFFGVKSPDARLQRPEYITGVKSPVIISEVLNTGGDQATLPQGNMAGHAVSVNQGKYGSYFCPEHGIIIGIMSVMPKPAYMQGIPKMFTKLTDAFDYYTPQFAHVGEQPILNKELYVDGANPDGTFGYTPRYGEYKVMPNRVAGDFQTTLDYWTAVRQFNAAPALNATFIECNPTHDIFAVTDPNVDKLYCQVLHKINAVRPMPVFGTPTF